MQNKFFSLICAFSLFFNSLLPVFSITPVYAQEATPLPTEAASPSPYAEPTIVPASTPEASPVPSESPVVEPSVNPLPVDSSPSATPDVTVSPSPELTPAPTESPAPTAQTEVAPTSSPTENNNQPNAPPTGSPSPSVSPSPVTSASPSNNPQTIHGNLTTTIAPNNADTKTLDLNPTNTTSASLTTNKPDYAPTDKVIISGTNFLPKTEYTLIITSSDVPAVNFSTKITTNEQGAFIYEYQLDGNYRPNYQVEVKDWMGTVVATTTFTDSALDFSQCSNKNSTLGQCVWIGSIVQQSNSQYYEGMSVAQRLLLTNISATSGNTHTLTFSHQATKSTTHAYDFLTAYNQGNTPLLTMNECNNLSGALGTTCSSLRSGSNHFTANAPDAMGTVSGDNVADRAAAYEGIAGNRTITLHGSSSISTASLAFNGYTNNGGDYYATYTLSWTSASSNILIEMAGHLAVTGNGTGLTYSSGGASNINGGPYHFKLDQLDNHSLGSQDNQIKGADVLPVPGTITIVKDARPDDAQDFTFTTTGSGLSSFSLDDDSDPTLSNTKVFSNIAAGTYSVTEGAVTGWSSDGGVCSDGSPVSAISLQAGENITCTFTNTKQSGALIVHKTFTDQHSNSGITINVSPGNLTQITNGSGDATFSNLTDGVSYSAVAVEPDGYYQSNTTCTNVPIVAGQTANCTITDSPILGTITVHKNLIGASTSLTQFCFTLNPDPGKGQICADANGDAVFTNVPKGTYTANETASNPDYSQTSSTCNIGMVIANNGDSASCTVSNTIKNGTIIIEKQMIGGTDSFSFTGELSGTISTVGGQLSKSVLPGTYSATESAKQGWDLTGLTCDDADSTGNISARTASFIVNPGETVKCTFTNTKRGHIIIQKNAVPDSNTQAFTFNNNFGNGNPGTFDLIDTTAAGYPSFDAEVLPGKYVVSENSVSGWKLERTSCDSGETIDDIDVGSGETVTCIFTNVKLAKITLVKNTVGGDGTFDFVMTGESLGTGSAQLTTVLGSATQVFSAIDPDGVYSITESVPIGWNLTGSSCNNGDPLNNITPNAGEEITCTFTNTKIPTITVNKVLSPGNDPGRFDLQIDKQTKAANVGNGGTTGPVEVTIGSHQISEEGNQTDLSKYDVTYSGDCPNGQITVAAGEDKTCTISNTRKTGRITIEKIVSGGDAQPGDWEFIIDEGDPYKSGDVLNINTGSYFVTESGPKGYTLSSASGVCNLDDGIITLTATEEGGTCMITNTRDTGSIIVHKAIDQGEGYQQDDAVANRLGFRWTLDGGSQQGMGASASAVTGDHNINEASAAGYIFKGWYENGEKYSCEEPEGTTLPISISFEKDWTREITLCNQKSEPLLIITKSNNVPAGIKVSQGGSVSYTITLEVSQNDAQGVTVTDLLPEGFYFDDGSWKVVSSDTSRGNNGDITGLLTAPAYHSPGVWTLGNVKNGEALTLTYSANVDGSEQPGLYKDLAWAKGTSSTGATVLASAEDPGFVSDNFVGTQVNIGKAGQGGAKVNIEKIEKIKGEVLGISLPSTGANIFWVILAGVLMALGVPMLALGIAANNRIGSKRKGKNA